MSETLLRKFTNKVQHVLLFGSRENGEPGLAYVDDSSHGLIAISHEHHEIHSGDAFRYTDSLTLASGAFQDYLLTVANTTKHPHFTFTVDGTAITTTQVFRATDRAGSTLQTTFNADENSTEVAGMTVHKGVTGGTTDGTLIFTYSSGTASGASKLDGSAIYSGERVLKQNTKYIVRVTSGTNGNLCNVRFEWYEHSKVD